MEIKSVNAMFRPDFDKIAVHPLQSWSWGEFREKLGQKIIRLGKFNGEKLIAGIQISIHQIPHTPWTIGYCPRGIMLDKEWIDAVKKEVKKYNCIFVKFEPNVTAIRENHDLRFTPARLDFVHAKSGRIYDLRKLGLRPGKPLFTP
ncbi:MAG: peptidoglycan bridge formation glycyltransferase FemA/FemB family protein, partial [Patescibacteria group bacterium]